ncbi:Exportin-4 [Liparis tanakae]|uniref:Exportin-4 n=1 Tax=Liparis tanakae TaxID=230148 RepID=A0A4Z2FT49_9TELE|nr:Exportin-4 [Liparis tanakae]
MSSEISQLCLEALSPLAEQCAKNQEKDTPLFVATRHFLKLVFDMLVLQKHNTEMSVAAGEALYTLVCLHQRSEVRGQVQNKHAGNRLGDTRGTFEGAGHG